MAQHKLFASERAGADFLESEGFMFGGHRFDQGAWEALQTTTWVKRQPMHSEFCRAELAPAPGSGGRSWVVTLMSTRD